MFLRLVVFKIRDLLNINSNFMHVRSKVPSDIKQGLQRFQNMIKGNLAHLLLVLTKIYVFGLNLPVQPLAGNVVVQLCATNLRGIRPNPLLSSQTSSISLQDDMRLSVFQQRLRRPFDHSIL